MNHDDYCYFPRPGCSFYAALVCLVPVVALVVLVGNALHLWG